MKCPFPGRDEGGSRPRRPQEGQGVAGDPAAFGAAQSPPGNPKFFAGRKKKFDSAEAFSKRLRVLSQPKHPEGLIFPPEWPGAAPGPGAAPAREPPAAGAAP